MSTAERVREIIVEQLGVDVAAVTADASFTDDLGA
ncbi:MAG: acyl carrier protein, partial [Calditrichaeota bacterium]|nr:acyl carrier protein [Calditrichota bacterium]